VTGATKIFSDSAGGSSTNAILSNVTFGGFSGSAFAYELQVLVDVGNTTIKINFYVNVLYK